MHIFEISHNTSVGIPVIAANSAYGAEHMYKILTLFMAVEVQLSVSMYHRVQCT